MKRNLPDLCFAVAIGAVMWWLCLHPRVLGSIALWIFALCLFAPYLAFPVWLATRRPPATAPDTLTPFILGVIVGHGFTGRGEHDHRDKLA